MCGILSVDLSSASWAFIPSRIKHLETAQMVIFSIISFCIHLVSSSYHHSFSLYLSSTCWTLASYFTECMNKRMTVEQDESNVGNFPSERILFITCCCCYVVVVAAAVHVHHDHNLERSRSPSLVQFSRIGFSSSFRQDKQNKTTTTKGHYHLMRSSLVLIVNGLCSG